MIYSYFLVLIKFQTTIQKLYKNGTNLDAIIKANKIPTDIVTEINEDQRLASK